MKKIIALFAIAGCLTFGMSNVVMAQEQKAPANDATEEQVDAEEEESATPAEAAAEEEVVEVAKPFNQVLRDKFIEGGPGWMTPILIVLILGLALVIERTIYLNLATTNTKKLLEDLEAAISTGDVEKAKDICRNTRDKSRRKGRPFRKEGGPCRQNTRLNSQPERVKTSQRKPRKVASRRGRITCLSMTSSGRLAATALRQKARVVPTGRPLAKRPAITGTMAVTLV